MMPIDRLKRVCVCRRVAEAGMKYNDCGLHGLVAVNVSFPDDSRCYGALSDWDASRCILRSSLTMTMPDCVRFHRKGIYVTLRFAIAG